MPVKEAERIAHVLLMGQADVGTTILTEGSWLHVVPRSEARAGHKRRTRRAGRQVFNVVAPGRAEAPPS